MKFLKKLQTKDPEIIKYLSVIGRLGMNIVISILVFFLIFRWLDRMLQTGNILLIAGILIGVFSGVYLNYRYLKQFYDKE